MIKDFLHQIKYSLAQFSFNRKKKLTEKLIKDFGAIKEEAFDFELIEKYFKNKNNAGAFQVLSDKTCKDLDFDEVFMFIDRTNSKVGQQYLYDKLRAIHLDEQEVRLNEELIAHLANDVELRISLQKSIDQLKHKDAYSISTLFQEKHIEPPKWFFLIKLLSLSSLASLVLGFFYPLFFILLLGVFCINFVIHYWNKTNLVHYVGSIPQLLKLNTVATRLFNYTQLKKINPDLPKSIKTINQVKTRMAFFQLEAKLQSDVEIIGWFLFELFKTTFLLEPILLFSALKKLDTKRKEIEDVFTFVGHVDMLVSIASLRKGLDTYCLPTINQEVKIHANKISHPLVANCTTNTIQIDQKSILLTGSNMSGKTTFIRAIGINVITGLAINTCFAESMVFPKLKIATAIRISDDLMNDKSYYFEEVATIKEMIALSKNENNNLFLLDEIFKGTNTVERIAAGKAVLSTLANKKNRVLVSTHDIELTDMLADEYDLYHFSENVDDKTVGFDYTLKVGKLKNRNAIRILEINDYPKEVIDEALEIAKQLDERYLTSINGTNTTKP